MDDVVLFWWVRKGCDWLRFTDAILIGSRRGFDNKGGKSVWSGSGIGEHGFFCVLLGSFFSEEGVSDRGCRRDLHELATSAREGGQTGDHFRAPSNFYGHS